MRPYTPTQTLPINGYYFICMTEKEIMKEAGGPCVAELHHFEFGDSAKVE
jgi:hypothetical protein